MGEDKFVYNKSGDVYGVHAKNASYLSMTARRLVDGGYTGRSGNRKTSGYWRAKGFKQPGVLERLEREDGVIVHQRREWRMYDPETGKLTTKAGTLWGLLKKIH